MPGILSGRSLDWFSLIGSLSFGSEAGIIGLPSRVMVDMLLGFLVFAGVLLASGAGRFFLNLASALLGRYRGGPAKVAVLGSGFFGSMSGSAISNVVGTGSITIPAMKRLGYPPHYAAAIEACASTGGTIMPPIMGAVAFIMAELLGIPYSAIIVAAAIPAILYYLGLLMQVDAYAAKNGLIGLPREEIPSLKQTLIEGWHFIFAFLFLIWGLLYMRWEAMTPWYTTGLLILLSMVRKETRIGPKGVINILREVGKLVTMTMGVIMPIAFIITGLTSTGVAPSFTSGVISLGGGNPFIILLFGAVACYLLGMMGLVAPAYIFLAVSLAPVLTQMGFDLFASHLFIIYCAIFGDITLPVAIVAFVGAGIAGAPPMKTALLAMRLGIVLYFIPFFFVFEPALVLRGAPLETLYYFSGCLLGIFILTGGLEGFLLGVGKVAIWARPLLVVAGFLVGFPEWRTDVYGIALAIIIIGILLVMKRSRRLPPGGDSRVYKLWI